MKKTNCSKQKHINNQCINLTMTLLLFSMSFMSSAQTLFFSKFGSGGTSSIVKTSNCDTTTVYHNEVIHLGYSYLPKPFAVIDENNLLIPVYNSSLYSSIIYKWNIPNQALDSISSLSGAVASVHVNEFTGVITFYSDNEVRHLNPDLTENNSEPTNGGIITFYHDNGFKILQFSSTVLAKADSYRVYKGILSSGGMAELPNFFEVDKIITGFVKINDTEGIIISFKNNSNVALQKMYINKYNITSNSHTLIDSIPYSSPSFNNFYNANKFYFGGGDSIYFFNNSYGANLVGQISLYSFSSKTTSTLYDYNSTSEQLKDVIYNQGKLLSYNSYAVINNPTSLMICNPNPNNGLDNLICYGCTAPTSTLETMELASNNLFLHPNPASSNVNINLSNIQGSTPIYIYSASGQLVYEEMRDVNNSENFSIPIAPFQPGVYFVKAGSSTQKLIIE